MGMSRKGLSPKEFMEYINKPLEEDKIETYFHVNNVISNKAELYRDYIYGVLHCIDDTYPGDDINMDDVDIENHFNYCWNKTIDNFKLEGLYFEGDSKQIKEYFLVTLLENYYSEDNKKRAVSVLLGMYDSVFNMDNQLRTLSDMDMFIELYKYFNKFLKGQ